MILELFFSTIKYTKQKQTGEMARLKVNKVWETKMEGLSGLKTGRPNNAVGYFTSA